MVEGVIIVLLTNDLGLDFVQKEWQRQEVVSGCVLVLKRDAENVETNNLQTFQALEERSTSMKLNFRLGFGTWHADAPGFPSPDWH